MPPPGAATVTSAVCVLVVVALTPFTPNGYAPGVSPAGIVSVNV